MRRWFLAWVVCYAVVAPLLAMGSQPVNNISEPTDGYFIYDSSSGMEKNLYFSISSPAGNGDLQTVKEVITNTLTDLGYQAKDFLPPYKETIIVTFAVTNETRKVEIYVNESSTRKTAEIYQNYYETENTFYHDLTNYAGKSMFRRETITAPVETLLISAYVISPKQTAQKVWDGVVSSLEGTSQSLPALAQKALSNFPPQAAKVKP